MAIEDVEREADLVTKQCRVRPATAPYATAAHALAPRGCVLLRDNNDATRHLDASAVPGRRDAWGWRRFWAGRHRASHEQDKRS